MHCRLIQHRCWTVEQQCVRRCRHILQRRVLIHGICIPAQGSVTNIPELTCDLYRSMISGTGFYGSNDPTNTVKAMKEVVALRIRLQSYQAHPAMLK